MHTLYLIRGVPGSGKSTFAQKLRNSGIVDFVYEADQYFHNWGNYQFDPARLPEAHNYCQTMCFEALKDGYNVAVSNTSTTEKEVEIYRKIAEETDANFVSLVVESRHNGKNVHDVPPEKIEQMKQRFSIKL